MSLKTSVMEFLKIDELKDNLIKLLEAKFELKKLEIIDQAKPKLADLVFSLILILLGILSYILIFSSLAIFLGNLLFDSPSLGLLCMGLLHVLILIVFYLNASSIKSKISEKVSEKLDANS